MTDCLTETVTKCFGDYFDTTLCTTRKWMQVTGAVYGVSECAPSASNCCPQQDDCTVPMADHLPYYEHIKDKCNGRRSCGDLRANRLGPNTCGITATDYVTIFFDCLALEGELSIMYLLRCPYPLSFGGIGILTNFPDKCSKKRSSCMESEPLILLIKGNCVNIYLV